MFMIDYKELSWWYWLVTVFLLMAGLAGYPVYYLLAIGLTLIQVINFAVREHKISAFPVQVRFWYMILLIVALPAPMHWLYWIPTIGTWAQLIFGYCTMARCVSLFPWNRNQPISLELLKKTFFSRPTRGNILQGLPAKS